jgi:hypothetical protein
VPHGGSEIVFLSDVVCKNDPKMYFTVPEHLSPIGLTLVLTKSMSPGL